MNTVFLLLAVYQLKHFVADYPLQTAYMLGKFKEKGWVMPLASHAGVHALFTVVISAVFLAYRGKAVFPLALGLMILDFVVHFTMDRIKASPSMLGRFKDMYHRYFWWCLGFDQMVHHLTHYTIIYILIHQ